MMKINDQKLRAVTALAGPERYSHFVKVVADQRKAWGLYQDGWALTADEDGNFYFPLWPAKPYAEQCVLGVWKDYAAKEIDLEDLLNSLMPKLASSGSLLAIFPTPQEKGVVPPLELLETDLRSELSRME